MQWVGRRRFESEVPVKCRRLFVLCVRGKRPQASDLCGLHRPSHSVAQQGGSNATALPGTMYCHPCKHHQGNRMVREAFAEAARHFRMVDVAKYESIESDDGGVGQTNVGC